MEQYAEIICTRLAAMCDRMRLTPGNTITLFGHAVRLASLSVPLCQYSFCLALGSLGG